MNLSQRALLRWASRGYFGLFVFTATRPVCAALNETLTVPVRSQTGSGDLLSFSRVLELTKNSPEYMKAKSTIIQRDAEVTKAYDVYVPDFDVGSSYDFGDGRMTARLRLRVTLLDRGKDINNIRLARSEKRVAELGLTKSSRDARVLAAQAYFDLLVDNARLKINQEAVPFVEGTLNKARLAFKNQAGTRTQIWRLEGLLLTLRRELVISQSIYDEKIVKFGEALGLKEKPRMPRGEIEAVNIDREFLRDKKRLKDLALQNSQEVRIWDEQISQVGARKGLLYERGFPHVSFQTDYGDLPVVGTRPDKPRFFYSLSFAIPLMNYALLRNPVEKIVGELESRARIDRVRYIDSLSSRVEMLVDRIRSEGELLSSTAEAKGYLQREISESRKLYIIGVLDASIFVTGFMRNLEEQVRVRELIKSINSDYYELKSLVGANTDEFMKF